MSPESCPDQSSLRNLLSGQLSDTRSEELAQHLLQCEFCTTQAREVAVDDDLTEALRGRLPHAAHEPALAAIIDRSKQLLGEVDTNTNEATKSAGRQDKNAGDDRIDFLAPPEKPGELGRLANYVVLDVLGKGGMGIVFRAEDPELRRQIALKVMRPILAENPSARERFLREARATAAIEHDNIVAIHQVGEDRGVPFIAMPLLRGVSLQELVDQEPQLPQGKVLRIGREVATGLAAAHQKGLIHRDIKPDNVWIEKESGRVKILDFGLVRATWDEVQLTTRGIAIGSPRYMAPEQALGEKVDHRCDLFSLGGVLYLLASGQAPFASDSLTATLLAVAQADYTPIEQVNPDLHPRLAELIRRLLEKSADARPQTALEVAEALAAIEKLLERGDGNLDKTRQPPEPPQELPNSQRSKSWRFYLAAAVLAAAATILYFTAKGTVVVVLPDDAPSDLSVRIYVETGGPLELDQGNRWTLKLPAGRHKMGVRRGKREFRLAQENSFVKISRFRRTVVHVERFRRIPVTIKDLIDALEHIAENKWLPTHVVSPSRLRDGADVDPGLALERARATEKALQEEVKKQMTLIAREEVSTEKLKVKIESVEQSTASARNMIKRLQDDLSKGKQEYLYQDQVFSRQQVEKDLKRRQESLAVGALGLEKQKEVLQSRQKGLAAAKASWRLMDDGLQKLRLEIENLETVMAVRKIPLEKVDSQ